ncbi:MAG: PEP/pyruvate-binding domain-containing protein [Caulobacterales bacterium]
MGRKAAVLGWAESQGIATPGGLVLPSERFWTVLQACGAFQQARYLQENALRLDPRHTLNLAGAIRAQMSAPEVDAMALADAQAAFPRLEARTVVCRSSSAMEDGRAAAFPGVFVSVLDLRSSEALGAAIARCWRSAFSAQAFAYILRLRAEPIELALAVLMQRQVAAQWYGIYAGADPLTGALEPVAELTSLGPEALVSGGAARLTARRRDERWDGLATKPDLAPKLEEVRRAAVLFAQRLGAEVDIEFAIQSDAPPTILQCRPLTRIAAARGARHIEPLAERMVGERRAPGHVVGLAVDPAQPVSDPATPRIAVLSRLTTDDYAIVFDYAGIVTEENASSLSHVAILCRELGVPFVCGVRDARARLIGQWARLDGGAGEVTEIEPPSYAPAAQPSRGNSADPSLSTVELLLRVLAEAENGGRLAKEAERIRRRYACSFGRRHARLTPAVASRSECARLDEMAAALFGLGFTAYDTLTAWNAELSASAPAVWNPPILASAGTSSSSHTR